MTPMGFVEEELAELWRGLLGVTGVTMDARFTDLGGDVRAAERLASLVREALGVEVSAREMLEAGDLGEMARRVRAAMEPPPAPVAAARTREGPPPLSFAQQRMWFMQQIDPGTTLYNVPAILHLRGALDRAALERALDRLVGRHESLRTSFPAPGGRPHQRVAPASGLRLEWTDLTGHAEPEGEAARVAAEEAALPFDLAAAPPLRARLVRLAPGEHRLLVTFHHIVVDGWSLDVAFRELAALYGAEVAGAEPRLPAAPQYPDYAVWQREWLRDDVLAGLVDHWRGVLGEDPVALEVPTDRPRPAAPRYRGALATRAIDPALVRRLRGFGARERATPAMTTLAGFAVLLAGWAGVTDVTVGSPVAGRTRPELQDMVGCLINMVPVRVGLAGDPGFRDVTARVRAAVVDASAHQDLPFDKLVEALVPPGRRRGFAPVFRVMFSYLKEPPPLAFAGLERAVLDRQGPQGTAKYDLSLYAEESGEGLALTLEYDTDLFEPRTPAALLAAYEATLAGAAADPDTPLSRLAAIGSGVPRTERSAYVDR
ncbi:hypothetical protein DQ384_29980 [Sphaerisporangium album]|uniref:Carrier domain-containing protein n=1 Tax=Sphaerisporangium album TaxID=509200 RepID=A0A367F8M6_9ACTN|nr:condensation domain-containing protein [Sphaerisporangium album]RCG26202.1 hypothetical protein DQ384_29980 [Sphaerisporangium album]